MSSMIPTLSLPLSAKLSQDSLPLNSSFSSSSLLRLKLKRKQEILWSKTEARNRSSHSFPSLLVSCLRPSPLSNTYLMKWLSMCLSGMTSPKRLYFSSTKASFPHSPTCWLVWPPLFIPSLLSSLINFSH